MSSIDTVMQRVAGVGSGQPAHVFTYSFGSDSSDALNIPKQISCAHEGAWTAIQDGGDLITTMSSYYKFLATGVAAQFLEKGASVRWSEPYDDYSTGRRMVTASLPVYDTA